MAHFDDPNIRFDDGHFYDEPDPITPTTGPIMPLFRIALGFARLKDPDLDDFASNVVIKTTANATLFTGQTANVTAVGTAQTAYHDALAVAKGGGTLATDNKNHKKSVLLAALRVLAFGIQGIPGLTAEDARKSGFDVIEAGPHAPVAVDRPVIEDLTNVASGKLGVKVTPPKGYKSLEFRKIVGTAAPVHAGTFPSSHGVVLEECASGQLHTIEARAVFGGKRYSEWSEPVSHMAT